MPYVDKVKSVKKTTGVSQPRWAIWREIWKWSCLPSLLYYISRKTVDTEYRYYSWCMTSTDIVKWRKNEWLWKFWKRNYLYENFEKRGGGSREKGERGNEIHTPCACDYICSIYAVWDLKTKCFVYSLFIKIKLFGVHLNPYKSLLFHWNKIRNILCSEEWSEGEHNCSDSVIYIFSFYYRLWKKKLSCNC